MALPALAEHLLAIATGEKPLPISKAKRHHYVPQFLLTNFTSPSAVGDPKLRVLDKRTGSIEEVTPGGTGWERNLYSIHREGQRDNRVEALLNLFETHAAEALVRFLADPLGLSFDDRFTLSIYLSLQESRTPAALAERREFLRHVGVMTSAMSLANAAERGVPRARIRAAQEALLSGQVGVEPNDEMSLGLMFQSIVHSAEAICGLSWVLFEATEGEFVLSDRPLTRRDPRPPHPFSAGAWMSSDFVYTTLPLDPTHCLRISPNGREPITVRSTSQQVTKTNLRTYGWGTRYVMARSMTVLEELHQSALRDPESVPAPIRQRIVILEDPETADPAQPEANRRKGWDPYLAVRMDDGFRTLSYSVIDTVDDARAAMAPHPGARDQSRTPPG